jgi:predicted SAM-dependent methyltransferase
MHDLELRKNKIHTILNLLEEKTDVVDASNMASHFSFLEGDNELLHAVMLSLVGIESLQSSILSLHLLLIHNARLKLVKYLLPQGKLILDLGGANAPLYHMGYAHAFEKLILIDLPTEDRHQDFQVELDEHNNGKIILRYDDMTKLKGIEDNSIDLVWSGQSIEHITKEQGKKMCEEVLRVLKKGGRFCLDTPNRLVTSLHTKDIGGGFIHPDHKIEYIPHELRRVLEKTGFEIVEEWGICEMPLSVQKQMFVYEDFIYGGAISKNINDSYIQFFHCRKPMKKSYIKGNYLSKIKNKIRGLIKK